METRNIKQATKAFREGLILAYDYTEANITNKVFPQNDYAKELCREQLKIAFFEDIEEPDYPPTEREFEEFIESLVFYIYTGDNQPQSLSEAIKLTQGESFWGPEYIWIKGEMFDTYNIPATDKDGNITGIRF